MLFDPREVRLGSNLRGLLAFAFLLPALGAASAYASDDCLRACPTRAGPFGHRELDRECVKRCLIGGEMPSATKSESKSPEKAAPRAATFRFTSSWDADPRLRDQRASMEQLLNQLPNDMFRQWLKRNVTIDRLSPSPGRPTLGVVPGTLRVYDAFWLPKFDSHKQTSVLSFELGKLLWFDRINRDGNGPPRSQMQAEFERLYLRHQGAMNSMRHALYEGNDLGRLGDNDMQSMFSYGLRVVLLNLPPPAQLPPGEKWQEARSELRQFVAGLLGEPPRP